MWGVRYIVAYTIGTVVGTVNEFIQKSEQPCFQLPKYSHFLTCAGANVYGWSVLVLTMYFDLMRKLRCTTSVTLLAVPLILTGLEAGMGEISKWHFKERRWQYPKSYYPICGGTISLVSSLYFTVIGIAYWYILYKPLISKL